MYRNELDDPPLVPHRVNPVGGRQTMADYRVVLNASREPWNRPALHR